MGRAFGFMHVALVCGLAVAAMLLFAHLGRPRYVLDLQIPGDTSFLHCYDHVALQISDRGRFVLVPSTRTPRAIAWGRQVAGDSLGPALLRLFRNRPDKALRLDVDAAVRYGEMIRVVDVARMAGVKVFLFSRGGVCDHYRDLPKV